MINLNLKRIRQRISPRVNIASRVLIQHAEFKRTKELRSEILFGRKSLFSDEWLSPLLRQKKSQHFIITDRTVGALYGVEVSNFLRKYMLNFDVLTVPAGEKSKSLYVYEQLSSKILKSGIDKNSYVIGLGGGVVSNIAGFLASTLYRGIGLIQIPTSLLAQVDAAIDFKQAINGPGGKNHIGSYYPAENIVIDPDVLRTLSRRHLKNGFAESIKHALTQDRVFSDYLLTCTGNLENPVFIDDTIVRTVDLKIRLLNESVNADFSEMLPQYGHAIGHALEQASNYKLLHGEAIAIGMCIMAEIALLLGVCSEDTIATHYEIMKKFGLPAKIPQNISVDELLTVLQHDKHFSHGEMKSALVAKIGSVGSSPDHDCVFSIKNKLVRTAISKNRNRNLNRMDSYAK